MILMPISATVIIRLLSGFGHEAVAASGAASRTEMFAFMVPMTLGISLPPFVSQNFGAGRMDHIRQAQKFATRFALGYGGVIAIVFFLAAPWLAAIFTDDPKVAETLVSYVRIISFGYGMMEVHRYCGFFLTGMHRPVSTTILNAFRVLGLLIPLSYLGAHLWGMIAVFSGRLVTDIVAGLIGIAWVARPPCRPDQASVSIRNARNHRPVPPCGRGQAQASISYSKVLLYKLQQAVFVPLISHASKAG